MMVKKSTLCVLIGLLAASCQACVLPATRTPILTLHGDESFAPNERKCVEDSAEQWRNQTSGLADVDFEWNYNTKNPLDVIKHRINHRLVRWTSETPEVKEIDEEMTDDPEHPVVLLGQVNGKGIKDPFHGTIEMRLVMDRLQDPHLCRLTSIHELGHVFGIPHMPKKTDIMYPTVIASRTACLKKDDLLAFCFLNDCGNVEMKPCEDEVFPEPARLFIGAAPEPEGAH